MIIYDNGYGVCRNVSDAKEIAATARKEGLRGCYPAAAVVLAEALTKLEVNSFDYVKEALVTMSPSWHGEKVSFNVLCNVLIQAAKALQNLDAIKKTLFYGRELPPHLQTEDKENCQTIPTWFKNEKFGEYVIHAIIGATTEAGELLEALQKTIINGKEFDEINMREEVGDVFWYLAVLADTCGFTFEESQEINIAKLRVRYPNKFTAFDANNRNLEEERRILEKTA